MFKKIQLSLEVIALFFIVSVLEGCFQASLAPKAPDAEKPQPVSSAEVNTVVQSPDTGKSSGSTKTMVASFYGKELHGNKTASGEIFNKNALTAAHRTYPFGQKLKVTNPDNGKSVVVRINDRGPHIAGRDIDLSAGAAEQIGMKGDGVQKVNVELLP